MVLTKRERVIRTLELEEPDMIPIHYLGFETTGISNQYFQNSDEYQKIKAGYFVGPSHNILNMPWENVLAMRAAIEKYRKYPINLN